MSEANEAGCEDYRERDEGEDCEEEDLDALEEKRQAEDAWHCDLQPFARGYCLGEEAMIDGL